MTAGEVRSSRYWSKTPWVCNANLNIESSQLRQRMIAYSIVQACKGLQMSVGDFVYRGLPLLSDLHEQRERKLRIQQRLSETLRALEYRVARIEPCTSCRRSNRLDPERRSTGHGGDLSLRKARKRLDACHFPNELAQDDNLCRLAGVKLVHDVLE